jgi:hypothetical protein
VLWLSLTALAGVGVVRAVLRRRTAAVEIALWLVAAVPLLLVIAHSGLMTRHAGGIGFEQARYLFPLAPLGVAGVALAIKQLPTRVHGGMAAVLSVVAITQATALWLVTIGRYFA